VPVRVIHRTWRRGGSEHASVRLIMAALICMIR
jgi:hypothetical protein